jgi:hypothetical protein
MKICNAIAECYHGDEEDIIEKVEFEIYLERKY